MRDEWATGTVYANLRELEKEMKQKWNEIDDQTVLKAILQSKRRSAAVTKCGG